MQKQFAKFVKFLVDEMQHISQQLLYCKRMIKKVKETGSIMGSKLPVHHPTSWSLDNIAAVSESVAEIPGTPLRHHSQQVDILRSTTQRISRKICICMLTRFKWHKNSSQQTMRSEKNFLVVSSHAMKIRIGHRGHAIWHHVTSFFGGLQNLVSMPTNRKQFLSSRRRFDVSSVKMSCNYAKMSSRVSSKEQECASRVVGDICRILYCAINRSVCTFYWNKNIDTSLFE